MLQANDFASLPFYLYNWSIFNFQEFFYVPLFYINHNHILSKLHDIVLQSVLNDQNNINVHILLLLFRGWELPLPRWNMEKPRKNKEDVTLLMFCSCLLFSKCFKCNFLLNLFSERLCSCSMLKFKMVHNFFKGLK